MMATLRTTQIGKRMVWNWFLILDFLGIMKAESYLVNLGAWDKLVSNQVTSSQHKICMTSTLLLSLGKKKSPGL